MITLGRLKSAFPSGFRHRDERFVQINDVVVDWEKGRVFRDGDAIPVEARPMAFLRQLCAANGKTVTREEALKISWNGTHVVDEAIMRAVSVLRAALGDAASEPKFIETVPKQGYRLIAAVRPLSAEKRNFAPSRIAAMACIAAAGIAVGWALPKDKPGKAPPIRAINLATGEVTTIQ